MSPNVQRLLKEAKDLLIEEYHATACVLARVILELTVSDPKVLIWSGMKESDPLADKVKGCISKIEPHINNPRKNTHQTLVQAYLETDNVVKYLHQFVHNPTIMSNPHLARTFSAAFSPLLNEINEAIE